MLLSSEEVPNVSLAAEAPQRKSEVRERSQDVQSCLRMEKARAGLGMARAGEGQRSALMRKQA